MKAEGFWKSVLLTFLVAFVCYVAIYRTIEHRRTMKGPWEVTFTNTPAGRPMLVINQPKLGIAKVQIQFDGNVDLVTNGLGNWAFSDPRPVPYPTPFGKCIFMDTTFLPGTIVLEIYGHEIEMLPRVLVVDGREHPWRSGSKIVLPAVSQTQSERPKLKDR